MPRLIPYLLVLGSLGLFPAQALETKFSSTVPLKSCPFLRGRDEPRIKQVMDDSLKSIETLAKKCADIEKPAADLTLAAAALERYQAEMGIKVSGEIDDKADPKLPDGYAEVPISCNNYETEMPREWQEAKQRRQAGKKHYGAYDKSCPEKGGAEKELACMDDVFWENFSKVKSFCLGRGEARDKIESTKIVVEGYNQLRKAATSLIEGSNKCPPEIVSEVIKHTLSTLNSIGALGPATGLANLGVALGGDAIISLSKQLSGQFTLARRLRGTQAKMARANLFCAYLDAEYLANQCDRQSSANRTADPLLAPVPQPVKDFYEGSGRLASARELSRAIRGIQKEKLDDLLNLKNEESPLRSLERLMSGQTIDPETGRRTEMRSFLQTVVDTLGTAQGETNDETNALHFLATQLYGALITFDQYKKTGTPESSVQLINALKSTKVTGSPVEQPPLDLEFVIARYFDLGSPGRNGFKAQLMKDAHENSAARLRSLKDGLRNGMQYQQDDLDWQFTSLWETAKPDLLGEIAEADRTFRHHPLTRQELSDKSEEGKNTRENHFWPNIYPLVRACLAFRGAAYYEGRTERKRFTTIPPSKAHYGLTSARARNSQFDATCAPVACLIPPYNGTNDATFRKSQCDLAERGDEITHEILENFRDNGRLCATHTVRKPVVDDVVERARDSRTPKPDNRSRIHQLGQRFFGNDSDTRRR
jgi:hypothetical protein